MRDWPYKKCFRKFLMIAGLVLLCCGCANSTRPDGANAEETERDYPKHGAFIEEVDHPKLPEKLLVPTIEYVLEYGYPVNENGETYGPNVYDSYELAPDLMLAHNSELPGYIKRSEADAGSDVQTPEEALAYNENRPQYLNMYMQDGETWVGKFKIGGTTYAVIPR